ncbi:MAG: hypothetical protein M1828_006050 [Chrysothrix sp. TS-e1954]|nr:MAG: hypothetical protein M1828_006050 [Chrysothrix sp. TS-e1954]
MSAAAALAIIGIAASQDDSSENTVNVCINPRACFTNTASPDVQYCVDTPWHITYPHLLRAEIFDTAKNPNYTRLDHDDVYPCGWSYAYGVDRIGVWRGAVYYRTPGNGSFDYPPTLGRDTEGALNALYNTYPGTEIALILLFTVGLPFVILTLVILGFIARGLGECLTGGCRKSAREVAVRADSAEERRRRKQREKEAIELRPSKGAGRQSGKGSRGIPVRNGAQPKLNRSNSEDTLAWNGTEKMPDGSNGSDSVV